MTFIASYSDMNISLFKKTDTQIINYTYLYIILRRYILTVVIHVHIILCSYASINYYYTCCRNKISIFFTYIYWRPMEIDISSTKIPFYRFINAIGYKLYFACKLIFYHYFCSYYNNI